MRYAVAFFIMIAIVLAVAWNTSICTKQRGDIVAIAADGARYVIAENVEKRECRDLLPRI